MKVRGTGNRIGNGNGNATGKARLRGQPLIVIGLLLVGWVGVRSATWEPPFALASVDTGLAIAAPDALAAQDQQQLVQVPQQDSDSNLARDPAPAPMQMPILPRAFGESEGRVAPEILPAISDSAPEMNRPKANRSSEQGGHQGRAISGNFVPASPRMAAGHAMLMAAAFSQMEVPEHLQTFFRRNDEANGGGRDEPSNLLARRSGGDQAAPYVVPYAQNQSGSADRTSQPHRWSADAWLLWRQDNASPLLSGRPAYGRSQAGAVVRYSLARASSNRPQAHLRGSSALQGTREHEAAAGVSARPLAGVPVRVAGEVRVSQRAGGTEVRPAAYVVTELAPADLPAGLTGELYVQGGYVGGDFATGFVDGQLRIDRAVAGTHSAQLRAGAAVWGGAQRDAKRLDIGPSASVSFNLGEGRGRLAADYRFRVAGDAQPASGPALTLSAGF